MLFDVCYDLVQLSIHNPISFSYHFVTSYESELPLLICAALVTVTGM